MPIPLFFAIVPEADEVFVNGGVLETIRFGCLTAHNTLQAESPSTHHHPPKAYAEAKWKKIENFFD